MNVHINLLHDDERRYQGLVGQKFIIIATAATALALLLIVGGLFGYGLMSAQQELERLRIDWKQTDPRYKKFLMQQKVRDQVSAVLGELNGWTHGRLPMHTFLLEVQRVVAPYPVQLDRLTVAGEYSMVQPPPPKVVVKFVEPAPVVSTNAPPPPPPPIPARRWHITLTGRVFGAQGHTAVVELAARLQQAPGLSNVWESVRLQNIGRVPGDGSRNEQLFTIEGLTKLRKCE
jgi:hypothetical protein